MRVLFLGPYGIVGGAELALFTFLRHAPADVEVRALLASDGPLRERLAAMDVPAWVGAGYDGPPDVRRLGRFTRSLVALLDGWRPDVVWALGPKGALLAAPACRLRGVPVVWHKIDLSWDRELAQPLGVAVNGVISVSHGCAAALGPLRRRLLAIVPPPVTLPDDFAVPGDGPLTIGTLARGVPYKGHAVILRTAALLSDEFPDLRVLASCNPVAEFPDHRESLLALADELGLGGRVELPAWVDDRADILRRLSVFMVATYRDEQGFGLEGLSTAMLEAAWAGLPVVASAGGGTAEGLIEGETGRLVPEADPALLAEAIRPYLRDPALRARTGEAARRFARERFGPDVVAPRLFGALRVAAER